VTGHRLLTDGSGSESENYKCRKDLNLGAVLSNDAGKLYQDLHELAGGNYKTINALKADIQISRFKSCFKTRSGSD
jgi:hypothetical protein